MILLHAYFGAKRSHLAFVAQGLPRITDMAAEPDHPVVDLAPFGLREQFDQILFDVHGIGMLGEPEAPGDALDVRVHGKALVDAESAHRTTLAVLRATPGSLMRSFMVLGVSPLNSFTTSCAAAMRCFAWL